MTEFVDLVSNRLKLPRWYNDVRSPTPTSTVPVRDWRLLPSSATLAKALGIEYTSGDNESRRRLDAAIENEHCARYLVYWPEEFVRQHWNDGKIPDVLLVQMNQVN